MTALPFRGKCERPSTGPERACCGRDAEARRRPQVHERCIGIRRAGQQPRSSRTRLSHCARRGAAMGATTARRKCFLSTTRALSGRWRRVAQAVAAFRPLSRLSTRGLPVEDGKPVGQAEEPAPVGVGRLRREDASRSSASAGRARSPRARRQSLLPQAPLDRDRRPNRRADARLVRHRSAAVDAHGQDLGHPLVPVVPEGDRRAVRGRRTVRRPVSRVWKSMIQCRSMLSMDREDGSIVISRGEAAERTWGAGTPPAAPAAGAAPPRSPARGGRRGLRGRGRGLRPRRHSQ
jgi:hypothetical protein